ncbi:MAG: hypothetical protein F6K31_36885 [Symploca sp. SIO2G7]|nr:hypothetical protein [Symploca sp. SIO2G7]
MTPMTFMDGRSVPDSIFYWLISSFATMGKKATPLEKILVLLISGMRSQ